ncbi:MAG: NADP-dependent phosphogluconate dehydrogenase, partial [Betaproteobacteria bacterium]
MSHPPVREIAMIGLGRMGANMARRLARAGVSVHAFDSDASARKSLSGERGVHCHPAMREALGALGAPRAAWFMLPAGEITDSALTEASSWLRPGDIMVDGGNANYLDSQRRAASLSKEGLRFVDCGVSGGVHGLANGYCLMLGGAADSISDLGAVIAALAPAPVSGWVHCGPVGSGHFAKMIHNGIEYGMMQALAEGLALMGERPDLVVKPAEIAEAWREGSVIRSWLLDLC